MYSSVRISDRLSALLLWYVYACSNVMIETIGSTSYSVVQPAQSTTQNPRYMEISSEVLDHAKESEVSHLRGIQGSPRSPGPLCNYALFLLRDNRRDAASRCFQEALELSPGHLRSLCGYATLLYEDNDPKAEQIMRAALDIGGPAALLADSLAVMYSRVLCRLKRAEQLVSSSSDYALQSREGARSGLDAVLRHRKRSLRLIQLAARAPARYSHGGRLLRVRELA
jgi:hypothetical protein